MKKTGKSNKLLQTFKNVNTRYVHVHWALADQTMVSGVNFLTGILLARYLGLDEYGRFTLAWMTVMFFNSIQQAGIIAPMMSLGPKQNGEAETDYYSAILVQQIVWSVLGFFLLWGGVLLSTFIIPEWRVHDLGLPLASVLLAWQLQDFFRRYFFVRKKSKLAFLNDVISYLGQLTLLLAFFHWAHLTTAGVLWLIALTSTAAVLVGAYGLGPLRFSRKALCEVTRQHWYSAKWLIGSALIQWTSGNLFIVSLGAIVGSGAVGALRAAQNIMGVTHILFQGLENIVPAGAARNLNTDGRVAMQTYLCKVTLLCTGATALFCVVVAISSKWILTLFYGNSYNHFNYLLWWFVPIYLLISIGLPLRAGLRALTQTRPIFVAYVLMTTFAVLSSSFLVNSYGISGALAGILGTQLIFQGYLIFYYKFNIF